MRIVIRIAPIFAKEQISNLTGAMSCKSPQVMDTSRQILFYPFKFCT